ncbi:MAG TPA: YSC84-related protein [Micropepsaceae bacterium]|nr:YSC84-related protein [Micropepsaceae bacterium]
MLPVFRFAIGATVVLGLAVTAPYWATTQAANTHSSPAATHPTASATQAIAPASQAVAITTQVKSAATDDTDQLVGAVDPKQWMDIQNQLSRVSSVVGRFKSDAKMTALMRQARGSFIVPAFGHGSSPAMGPWGSAVLMANNNGHWSDAAFFTLGGGSLGPHVIANGGSLILLIMNDRAMGKFESGSNWSLSSAPGTNIVNYSAATPQDLSGQGADIIAWSASGGPNSDTAVSVTDISANSAWNGTVYGTPDLRNILANRVPYINQDVVNLRSAMPSTTAVANSNPATKNQPSQHG